MKAFLVNRYGKKEKLHLNYLLFLIIVFTLDADKGISRRAKMFQIDSEFIDGLEMKILLIVDLKWIEILEII